ncbi:Phage Host Specificity protein [Sinorhizobium sojae CCBAU 05684]|uniref:Phage Host Specificity protein n=1 Tax=Sinorhizobium sojae CCBAU 05684 TaxID=716928 RepID=A0A249P9T0_9HYPH|nr:phage tail protein [Sinorhizobium sojae]ASY62535.1 Phage Host Specificity protein [Sinorhizobium sojae CCBAU 05684]
MAWGIVGQSGVTPYGPFYGIATTEPVVTSSGGTSSGEIGLPSPLGDKIPQGIGTFPVYGKLIVDPDLLGGVTQSGDTTKVNLVLAFCETSLGGTVSLINLKANDKYIYRTETPTKTFPGTIRFYGGDQAALDTLLEDNLDNPTYWPKLAYAVLEGFDIAPYGNQLPSFQAELSTGASSSALSSAEATLNFGAIHDGSGGDENAIDRVRNHFYTSDLDNSTGDVYILTIDILTNQEINRAKVSWAGGTTDYIGYWVSLDGSDYIVGALIDDADNLYKLALINTVTGVVDEVLAPLTKTGTPFEPNPIRAQLISSGAATKYLVYSDAIGTVSDGNCPLMVTVADITAGTLTNIVHQFTNPVAASGSGEIRSTCPGPSVDGTAIMFFVPSDAGGGEDNNVWKAVFSEAGIVSVAIAHTGTDCRDVAYDWTDDTIVVYDATGALKKIDSLGSTLYTVATGVTDLRINYSHYETGGQFNFKCRDGFAAGCRVFGDGAVYLIDLSDGSTSFIIDDSDYMSGYVYYDQSKGYLTTDAVNLTFSGMTRYTLPLSTVPVFDLQTVYTKLAEYRGKFSSSDLTFTNFSGGECYGVVYENDTTLDNAEQDANNIFDVKIVPSDGKRKYIKAKRDGSFAVDDTLASTDIVEQAEFNIRKTMLSDEQSLVGARISYIDKNARFERTEQEYRRPVGIYSVTRSDRVEDVSTNFVLSSTQAMQAVTTKVYRSNFGLDQYAFTLAPSNFYNEPADIVQFDFEGFTIVGQINEANLSGELFTQDVVVTQYVQAIDADFTGVDLNLSDITDPSWLTRFLYLDAPLLSLGDDLGGTAVRQYAMLSGYGYGTFQGATLYRSYDGSSYGVLTSRYGVSPVVGRLEAITGSPVVNPGTDTASSLTVAVISGDTADLASITQAELYTGQNKALVGKPGRWVIIYFQTVSVTDKTATISNIIWSAPHYQTFLDDLTAGDYFVLLQPGHHVRFAGEAGRLGDSVFYKAASDAFNISQVPTESHTLVGRAEMPFPATNLTASIVGSDIALGWDWRSRLNPIAILTGPADTVHGESSLSFEIDIMDGSTVKRTLTATTNEKTYLAADISSDWGSMPADITFRVYQISALVGRGYVAEDTITL